MHVVIIGAYGSAGVAVAESLTDHVGREIDRLTLVDNGEPGGGLCILKGCMPSKEVLSAAAHRYQARHDHRLDGEPPTIDLEATVATKDDHVLGFAEHRRAAVHRMAETEGVEFLHGTATFVDDHTVRVRDIDGEAGERELDADYVVVATGSSVHVPDLPGIDDVDYMTSADVLDATELPDSGVVMGFGYVGMELVPYLKEAGVSDLTVIEHDDRPLDEADPAFGDEALAIYREEFGVEILTNAAEQSVEEMDDGGVRLRVEKDGEREVVEAEQLFLFTGRRPTVDGLGLENTPLSVGADWVDDTMQARDAETVFVVGDVNGKEPILHVAKEQGYLAADNLLAHARGDASEMVDYENVHHHVVFSAASVYPYARVGHSRASAEAAGLDFVAVSRDASDDGVFKTKATPRGRATLVVDADDGTVLGYQGLHYHADVMAKTMQVAVELGLDVHELPDRAYHPTTPEILDGLFRAAAELTR
ncbi:dihydrolipoamide dehydrogenase [Halogranum gelatinilyticum]|uniref:Dihydrolipoamide dehydrogenase n=1 Tax=Halogranum gelatinilyticum TaxID=660521 RepID=A0A1G9PP71_9EURY|nr:NAD(P)/FAD-dependent oxidoreductase [Halogranum gelatinilyticum]SDM00638.1 dihydrolipoamide dehydrogenase [Halogranum gelatinilyticum]